MNVCVNEEDLRDFSTVLLSFFRRGGRRFIKENPLSAASNKAIPIPLRLVCEDILLPFLEFGLSVLLTCWANNIFFPPIVDFVGCCIYTAVTGNLVTCYQIGFIVVHIRICRVENRTPGCWQCSCLYSLSSVPSICHPCRCWVYHICRIQMFLHRY